MNNFFVRALTGIIFVLAIVLAIFVHPIGFLVLFLVVSVLSMIELERLLCSKPDLWLLLNAILLGGSLFTLSFLSFYMNLSPDWLLVILPFIWFPFLLVLFHKQDMPFQKIAHYLLIAIYVSLPMFSLALLAFSDGHYNPELVVAFFIMIWVNDTGAYLVGVNFGKRRLFERISPKKSWEGFYGGVILTIIAAWLLMQWVQFGSLSLWLVSGLLVAVFGTLGDLVESMLKRSVQKKDSGSLLPGHGGVLDRFDGALFAAPIIGVLFYFFGNY